jgi:LAO/AO transport system kinase
MLAVAGYPWVILETVGVGQVEVEVVGHADSTVVVVTPGWGDAVQANKAGLMEIADVFVVNKADRPGAPEAVRDLERMLALAQPGAGGEGEAGGEWSPPILCTTATAGAGVEEVWRAVLDHRADMERTGDLADRRRRRAADEVTRLVAARLLEQAQDITRSDRAAALAAAVAAGEVDPWTAADELLDGR